MPNGGDFNRAVFQRLFEHEIYQALIRIIAAAHNFAVGSFASLLSEVFALHLVKHLFDVAEVTLYFYVMAVGLQNAVIFSLNEHLTGSGCATFKVARRKGHVIDGAVKTRKAGAFNFLKVGPRMLTLIRLNFLSQRTVTIWDAGAAFGANRVLAAQQELVPVITPERIFAPRRDVNSQSSRGRILLKNVADLFSQKTVASQPRAGHPCSVADIDISFLPACRQLLDSANGCVVKVPREHAEKFDTLEASAVVQLGPFGFRPDGKDSVNLKLFQKVHQDIGVAMLVLRKSYLDAVE